MRNEFIYEEINFYLHYVQEKSNIREKEENRSSLIIIIYIRRGYETNQKKKRRNLFILHQGGKRRNPSLVRGAERAPYFIDRTFYIEERTERSCVFLKLLFLT